MLFNQFGPKLAIRNETTNLDYFAWLDYMTCRIGDIVTGAEILEKPNDRIDPRRNTGVYYDTEDYALLHAHMVLRTTSNPKTHAFCAFKYGADENEVRRDHRHIFDGDEKRIIQLRPTSPEAVSVVRSLLSRQDIRHPGSFLWEATGIGPDELRPAICVAQYRYTFYVLLDGKDVLRCSLDRADVANLRQPEASRETGMFSEIELPIYPRISPSMLADARVEQLMTTLSSSLHESLGASSVHDSKYRRAARVLELLA
ncbi:hypothetical protein F4558_002768 [Micromonospora profundi]|uniref:hypothetical protein n=1 Tax=Micromonospora profundi TaxID=1420889 RepID=UPI0016AAD647|nr:hypothetical protein [Micromonospora profundi]NJC12942.1 hypothetical protein [Micromonospora profundi]